MLFEDLLWDFGTETFILPFLLPLGLDMLAFLAFLDIVLEPRPSDRNSDTFGAVGDHPSLLACGSGEASGSVTVATEESDSGRHDSMA